MEIDLETALEYEDDGGTVVAKVRGWPVLVPIGVKVPLLGVNTAEAPHR